MPPGEFMYIFIPLLGFSDSRNRSEATTTAAVASSIGPFMQMMRSFRRREKMSYARSPRLVCSTTIGTKLEVVEMEAGQAAVWQSVVDLLGEGLC